MNIGSRDRDSGSNTYMPEINPYIPVKVIIEADSSTPDFEVAIDPPNANSSWTKYTWASIAETNFEQGSSELVDAMLSGLPLLRSAALDDMAIRAVLRKNMKTDAEIAEGLKRIALGNAQQTD